MMDMLQVDLVLLTRTVLLIQTVPRMQTVLIQNY
jgi:hypothetical protein